MNKSEKKYVLIFLLLLLFNFLKTNKKQDSKKGIIKEESLEKTKTNNSDFFDPETYEREFDKAL